MQREEQREKWVDEGGGCAWGYISFPLTPPEINGAADVSSYSNSKLGFPFSWLEGEVLPDVRPVPGRPRAQADAHRLAGAFSFLRFHSVDWRP